MKPDDVEAEMDEAESMHRDLGQLGLTPLKLTVRGAITMPITMPMGGMCRSF